MLLPRNSFTGAELARALRLLATRLERDQAAEVSVAWKHGEPRSVEIGQLALLADPEQVTTIAVDWTFTPVVPGDGPVPAGGSTVLGRISGTLVERRRGTSAWVRGPWRRGHLTVEHGGWARVGLNACSTYLVARRPAVACARDRLLGFTPLFLLIVIVGFSQFLVHGSTYPSRPPFFSAITVLSVVLTLSYALIYYRGAEHVAGGTRLVEPEQVVRWSWLTPAVAVGFAGPFIALLALALTVFTNGVRMSGVLGGG